MLGSGFRGSWNPDILRSMRFAPEYDGAREDLLFCLDPFGDEAWWKGATGARGQAEYALARRSTAP
jgi:hypothetical protein